MKKINLKVPYFFNIFFVVVFSSLGYFFTSRIVTGNIIQFSTLPERIYLTVGDSSVINNHPRLREISLKIDSGYPISKASSIKTKGSKLVSGNILYHQNPIFLVWGILISIMVAIVCGSIPFFFYQARELKKRFKLTRVQISMGIVFSIMVGGFLVLTNDHLPGYYKPPQIINDFHILLKNGNILLGIVIVTISCCLPVFVVIFYVGMASDNVRQQVRTIDQIPRAVKKLKELNNTIHVALTVLSVVVVFTVLTSGALGQAIRKAVYIEKFDLYPKEVSYVYGMYFSLFLCVIYIPVYYYLKQNFISLKNMAEDDETISEEKKKEWYSSLFGDSKFEASAFGNVKLVLTIMAPFISSFLPGGLDFLR